MKVKVIVTLKNGVLDPQGKAIQQTLNGMNFGNVDDVRQGKYFEIEVKEKDEKKAKLLVDDMCKKLFLYLKESKTAGSRASSNIIMGLVSLTL